MEPILITLIIVLVIASLVVIVWVADNIEWEAVWGALVICGLVICLPILLIAHFFFSITAAIGTTVISILLSTFLIFSIVTFISTRSEVRAEKRHEKFRKERIKVLEKKLPNQINRLIKKHKSTIRSAYRNTVTSNSFGKKDYSRFTKELIEFIKDNSSIYKEMDSLDVSVSIKFESEESIQSIEDVIGVDDDETSFESSMDPIAYERLCADLFKKAGWRAKATQASSDQGVDVEAERKGVKLVAQCKRFSKQVGNKAVQEVVAGLKYYEAEVGVVIAPNGFTKSAIKLAEANDIKLIHHDEIKDL